MNDLAELAKKYKIVRPEDNMPYNDKVMMANFIKQCNDDTLQTTNKLQKGTHTEGNPIVAPIVNNVSPDAFRALGVAGQAGLAKRWQDMDNGAQRTCEELLANLAEAYALNKSGEPFKLAFGVQF